MKTGENQQMGTPKSKKGLKVFLILLIILLVIGGLGAGGYFYCKSKGIQLSQLKEKFFAKKENTVHKVNYTTYNWMTLNLRDAPDGKIIRALNKDSILIVTEEDDSGWLKVKVADKEGYVATSYTKDKKGYFRDSYETKNLTKHCKELISKYFTSDEQKILKEYEFRYIPDWVADCGAGRGYGLTGFYTTEPKVIYLRDSSFKTPNEHDEVILHQMVHAILPDSDWGTNSPFANRLKVAGYDAGVKSVTIHLGEDKYKSVQTGR